MLSAILAAALTATPASMALPPNGKWVVDYETDMCVASRSFGADPVLLAIQPGVDMTGKSATLFIVAPGSGDKSVRSGQAKITVRPSGQELRVDYASAALKTGERGYRLGTDEKATDAVFASSSLTIIIGSRRIDLATGQMRGVAAALAKCNDDLLHSWGVDTTALAIPVGKPGEWFGSYSYPATALRAGAEGRTVIALTVSPDGKPNACRTVVSAKNQALDDAACRVAMTRGRFEQSSDGRNHYAVLAVRWEMSGF